MRKAIAVILMILIVIPLLLMALLLVPMRTWVLDRNFYYDVLNGDRLMLFLQGDHFSVTPDSPLVASQGLMGTISVALKAVINPQYLETQSRSIIDNAFDFVLGAKSTLDIKLDLKPLKQEILGEKENGIISILVKNIPVCKEGQSEMMLGLPIVLCRPSLVSTQIFSENFIKVSLSNLINLLPDDYPIINIAPAKLDTALHWVHLIPGISVPHLLTLVVILVGLLALLLWFLTALAADPQWRIRLFWLGGSLLPPGFVVLLVGFLLRSTIMTTLLNNIWSQSVNIQIPVEMQSGIFNIIRYAALEISLPFLISGGLACGIAIAFLVWGITLRSVKSQSNQATQ